MSMPVMQVRVVRMPVHEPPVGVLVRVGLDAVPVGAVRVLVMRVMDVTVRVGERLVLVQMVVPLREMEPDARGHEASGRPERPARRLVEQPERKRGAEERRHREICAGARGTQVAQCDDE